MSNSFQHFDQFRYLLAGEWVKPSLMLALMCTCMVVGIATYLSRTTRKGYLTLWTLAWMFYSIYLAACFSVQESPGYLFLEIARNSCVGVTAVLVFWSSFQLTRRPRHWRELALGIVGIIIWSSVAVDRLQDEFLVRLPLFLLLAWASIYTGAVHLRGRKGNRGSRMVTVGFVLWGVHSLVFPFLVKTPSLVAIGYVSWAVFVLVSAAGLLVEEEVTASEVKWRSLFDSTNDAIFLIDLCTLQILDVNKAAQRLTERDATTLLGSSFLQLCPGLKREGCSPEDNHGMFRAVFRPYSEFSIVRSSGSPVTCEGETRLSQQGNRRALQINVREVGQRSKVGQQMRRSEKLTSLGQLVAGVAHELNNPLAVVMGYAQLLSRRADLDEKTRATLGMVCHESERAAKIVRNLLTFVRPAEPQVVASDINRLVSTVLESQMREMSAQRVQLERGRLQS
ncbi:MAG: PAS domain S-box protein [Verrucomicrobiae bacterium]|nr:PAS domain S-box protein [Verrucomicrobiae bacterium]